MGVVCSKDGGLSRTQAAEIWKFTEGFVGGKTKEKGVAVVKMGSDKAVNKNGRVISEEGTGDEMI